MIKADLCGALMSLDSPSDLDFKYYFNINNWKSSTHRTPFHLTNEGSTHRTLSCL